MRVNFYIKHISRYHTPSNRGTDGQIKSITKELIFDGQMKSDCMPNVGDRIIISGKAYTVTEKIFDTDYNSLGKIVYEVVSYTGYHVYQNGSDSWSEHIPLVTSISDIKTESESEE